MASLTRHFESSASSIMAGIIVFEKVSKPMTSLTHLIFFIMLSRTSAQSSLRKAFPIVLKLASKVTFSLLFERKIQVVDVIIITIA